MIFRYWESVRGEELFLEPLVPIIIHGPYDSLEVAALVDSGAERNVFPLELADYLDISLTEARPVTVVGVGDQQHDGHEVPVELQLERYRWTAPVIFSSAISGDAILGQEGFSTFFNVDFRHTRREMDIRRARQ